MIWHWICSLNWWWILILLGALLVAAVVVGLLELMRLIDSMDEQA